jgi:hypothetical protein
MSMRIFLLMENKIFIRSSENCEANGDGHDFISYKKWVQRKEYSNNTSRFLTLG